ncbi:alanine racemase [Swingsia samuiensis]|uniref:Alanine racemase n=1 Tax=Swingsia samuiensis TaxID=1293412 RepID=A0A4Y6UJJ4_9PROT|nr:alanine racemase [Swingsia samuiensis]QDH16808.1 alanine racemase [Swingsia samuiensis]
MTTSSRSSFWVASRAGATLTIDLPALADNYRFLKKKVGNTICAAVVKADAYGLGVEQVAPVLEAAGVEEFFVAHVDEGIRLKSIVSSNAKITVLHGFRPDSVEECIAYGLRPVLNNLEQIQLWKKAATRQERMLDAVLQVDSGMSRFGLSQKDVEYLAEHPEAFTGVKTSLIMSHLACADDPSSAENKHQLKQFKERSALLPKAPQSLAASSGIFLGPDYYLDLVRPGAALYGLAPNNVSSNPMKPVIRLQGRVVQIRDVQPGDGVGYGMSYRPDRPRKIAIVAVGYADGFARHNAGKGCAWFENIKLPIVGRISMDSLAVDVSELPESSLNLDMMLDLIGPHRSVDDVADAAGTIGYEILTSLGHRYERNYITFKKG